MCKVVVISGCTISEFSSALDFNLGRNARWREVPFAEVQKEARSYRSQGYCVLNSASAPFEFEYSEKLFDNMEMLEQDNYKVISASPDLEFSKVYIREFLQGEPDRYEVLEVCELEYEKGFGFTIVRDNGQRFSGSALNHLCLQVLRKVANTFGLTLFSFSSGGRHE